MARIKTGISGLDELIGGGFLKGDTYLVSGGTGTGKTVFGIQYLYSGAKDYGEPGIYVALEERPKKIRRNMQGFAWNLKSMEDKGKLAVLDAAAARIGIPTEEERVEFRPYELDTLIKDLYGIIDEIGAKRLVVDSVTALGFQYKDIFTIRRELLKLGVMLEETGCTSILTSEIEEGSGKLSRFGVEEFVAQGVISLQCIRSGAEFRRSIAIRKMRGSEHSLRIYPIEISSKGIVVYPTEEIIEE